MGYDGSDTGQFGGLVPALEAARPFRLADVKYKAAQIWSDVRLGVEEASNFNLLTREGWSAFASRMRAHKMQREKDEDEDSQEML